MRQNAALLCVAFLTLIAGFHLGSALGPEPDAPVAHGQASSGPVLIAASSTQNEAICFIYNTSTRQLVSYVQRPVGGLQLKGIRTCNADFNALFVEYPRSDSTTSVRNMKQHAEQLRSAAKREQQ